MKSILMSFFSFYGKVLKIYFYFWLSFSTFPPMNKEVMCGFPCGGLNPSKFERSVPTSFDNSSSFSATSLIDYWQMYFISFAAAFGSSENIPR